MNSDMDIKQRHGVAWFEISGLGIVKRDFMVDDPALLELPSRDVVYDLFRQIAIIDNSLPTLGVNCRPINMDITAGRIRRIYQYDNFALLLVQKL